MARPPANPISQHHVFAPANAEMVVVGAVGAAYGVKGWSHVNSFTEPPDNILDYACLYLDTAKGWRALKGLGLRRHQHGYVGRVCERADRDEARKLAKSLLAVRADELPAAELDEYYWRDLVGLAVSDVAGMSLGEVVGLLETGAHDVLRIASANQVAERPDELLVPFVAEYVVSVDLGAGTIIVDWDVDW